MPILALMVLYIRLILEEVLLQDKNMKLVFPSQAGKLPMTFINVQTHIRLAYQGLHIRLQL